MPTKQQLTGKLMQQLMHCAVGSLASLHCAVGCSLAPCHSPWLALQLPPPRLFSFLPCECRDGQRDFRSARCR